jgi:alkanesulfonate monooxygenase SsuD/methylene tetrahydromethanopterin reductase-like flavin-dependent oxidoreductase (luciferase family)
MRGPVPAGPVTGIHVPPHVPARELVGFVRKAEELGFPEVWVAEDCFLHGAFSQAATILASTASLRVGMGIIPAAARNVAFAAILAEPVTPEYLAMAVKQVGSAGHDFVAYNVASVDDDPAAARARARAAPAVVGEPDWRPHLAGFEFAAELAELRRSTGSAAAFAAALPDCWVDRLAIVGTPEQARDQVAALRDGGASRVVLIPAIPEPRAALDSLARLLE